MSDEELRLTRRLFMQHAAMASAMASGVAGIALKTDAVANVQRPQVSEFRAGEPSPYPYLEPPG